MTVHISARVAWHDDGWNGRVCSLPGANTYCVGAHSYPGALIAEQRDLAWETQAEVAGTIPRPDGRQPPCSYSFHAFATHEGVAHSDPPSFFKDSTRPKRWNLPPATVGLWPYEAMYNERVKLPSGAYDPEKRRVEAEAYFAAIEPNKSLIFYYANYSNPLSEDEARRYAIVGVSRIRAVGEPLYYEGFSDRTRERYGGYVWSRNVTSHYPDQGFRIPYHRYRDDREKLERLAVYPENPRNFKYATRHMTDDEALGTLERLLETCGTLIEIGDTAEQWRERREWLASVIAELWESRGAFPGMTRVLDLLTFRSAIPWFKERVLADAEQQAFDSLVSVIDGKTATVPNLTVPPEELQRVRRAWGLQPPDAQILLRESLPRFDLTTQQIQRVLDERRDKYSLTADLAEIAANPYLLTEQYQGDGPDDTISFGRIDRGALPSPELAVSPLVERDDWRRFRAACVQELRSAPADTFVPASALIHDVNHRLSFLPDWKRFQFTERYFDADRQQLEAAITLRQGPADARYVYWRPLYEDERVVDGALRELSNRRAIQLSRPVTRERWRELLSRPDSKLYETDPGRYSRIIESQAEVCERVFLRPLSIVTGAAGTGKTTIVKALMDGVELGHGGGTSFQLLAPTGKAADRIRKLTGKSAMTLHRFLAIHGFLNENMTLRRDGKVDDSITTYVVDECSMVDTELFAAFVRAVNWQAVQRLILVGDSSQLPPIGKGKVFADAVDWLEEAGGDGLGRLTLNVRQLENELTQRGTGILRLASVYERQARPAVEDTGIKAAHEDILRKVQAGGDVDRDLRVLYWRNGTELASKLLATMTADIETETGTKPDTERPWELWKAAFAEYKDPERLQVLTPYRGEVEGTEELNRVIQASANSRMRDNKGELHGITYNDKVIQIRNSTAARPVWAFNTVTRRSEKVAVFNGELGFTKVHGFDHRTWNTPWFRLRKLQVVLRGKEELWLNMDSASAVEENLELAYALSVHKAQGSEFQRVYLVVPKKRQALLSTELLYTGLTRASTHCTLLIEEDIGPLLSLRRPERSQIARINSSTFTFRPVPDVLRNLADWYVEGKIHRTLADHLVRSKSEVIISNMLHERGIPFEYEQRLTAPDGTFYLPDFTLKWRGETWYWEHLGMLELDDYRNHWETKRAWYEQFFPGRLVTTEESGDLSPRAKQLIDRTFN